VITSAHIKKMKQTEEKISMITAYDYPSAKLAEQAGMDMILVGDSLGMVVLGYDSTIPVTVDDMIHHGKAVTRGAQNTYVVVDMPFMSYHISNEETLRNATKIFQETGAHALKLEGADEVLDKIELLQKGGIPVVAHLGLTPQSVNVLEGYRVQGKDQTQAERLIEDAKKAEEKGAVALVLECVPKQLAERVSELLSIPVIGIGAGVGCDGQVLVYHDVLKYGVDRLPKFVKPYAEANDWMFEALKAYVQDVKTKNFPEDKHSFTMSEDALPPIYGGKDT